MDQDKRIVILGAGESGIGAAMLAKARGMIPFVSDNGKIKKEYQKILLKNGISHEEGGHDEKLILTADEVIKSPGIPETASILKKLNVYNIPVISEIEFASRYTRAKIIAITGTNGKTTTALLTHHILKQAGKNVCLAGNVGISFASEVIKDKYDYIVLEVSSFQLDHIHNFKPFIGVLLNITPDHLDRYDGIMKNYINSKFRLTQNMNEEDTFIYYKDDANIANYLDNHNLKPEKLGIALSDKPGTTAFMNGKYLKFNIPTISDSEFKVEMSKLTLSGPHNMINTMAAVTIARLLKVSEKDIESALHSFKNVPHRLEMIAEYQGITFINDSKATNLDATVQALKSFSEPIIWIAGGIDKGNDYGSVTRIISERVKGLICLGKDNKKLTTAFNGIIDHISETDKMKKAVKNAYNMAEEGDVILLSPACASFDLFENYTDRGIQFQKSVKNLINNIEKEELTKHE